MTCTQHPKAVLGIFFFNNHLPQLQKNLKSVSLTLWEFELKYKTNLQVCFLHYRKLKAGLLCSYIIITLLVSIVLLNIGISLRVFKHRRIPYRSLAELIIEMNPCLTDVSHLYASISRSTFCASPWTLMCAWNFRSPSSSSRPEKSISSTTQLEKRPTDERINNRISIIALC